MNGKFKKFEFVRQKSFSINFQSQLLFCNIELIFAVIEGGGRGALSIQTFSFFPQVCISLRFSVSTTSKEEEEKIILFFSFFSKKLLDVRILARGRFFRMSWFLKDCKDDRGRAGPKICGLARAKGEHERGSESEKEWVYVRAIERGSLRVSKSKRVR